MEPFVKWGETMEVRCMMCGKKEGINQEHNDFRKFEKNPKAVYICDLCMAKTFYEAKEGHKPIKPV
jgi:uncharacterized protein YlaI